MPESAQPLPAIEIQSEVAKGESPPWSVLAAGVFALALAFHMAEVVQGLGNSLAGPHEFRQTQTALTTYVMAKAGVRLNYETPVFGRPSVVPFEFPAYQAVVVLVRRTTGWPLDIAGRITSILFFYLSLPAIALALRCWRVAWPAIWLGLACVVLAPVYVFYTRAFLIESTAFCLAWVFVAAMSCAIFPPAHATSAHTLAAVCLALAGAILAALTKITTFAVFAGALILCWIWLRYETHEFVFHAPVARRILLRDAALIASVLTATLAIAWLWVRYTDAHKLSNPSPLAHRLTSDALRSWNFGTASQWTDARTYFVMAKHVLTTSAGSFLPIALLVSILAFLRSGRGLIVMLLLAFAGGPLVFTNLYVVHDYYWYANTAFLSLSVGLALGAAMVASPARPRWRVLAPLLAVVVGLAGSYHYSAYHFLQKVPPTDNVDLARLVRERTPENSSIVVFCNDWNPLIPYYAERRAFMAAWDPESFFEPGSQQAIANLAKYGNPVAGIAFFGALAEQIDLQDRVVAALPGPYATPVRQPGAVLFFRLPASL
jgi:hypothetical protein